MIALSLGWSHEEVGMLLRCCPSGAKRCNIVARRADTRNVSEDFQKHFLCPGHKICVRTKCCARGKTSQHLGNMITSAMLPPQFCRGLTPNPNPPQRSVVSYPRFIIEVEIPESMLSVTMSSGMPPDLKCNAHVLKARVQPFHS